MILPHACNLKSDSHLPKKKNICFNDSSLKVMKNAIYFNLKRLSLPKMSQIMECAFKTLLPLTCRKHNAFQNFAVLVCWAAPNYYIQMLNVITSFF